MSEIKIDPKVFETMKQNIYFSERQNYKTKNLNDTQMITEVKKIIENEVIKNGN